MDSFSVEAILSAVDRNFASTMNSARSSMTGLSDDAGRTGNSIMDIAKGAGVFKLVEAGVNLVKGSLDGAINRFDTLNKYPVVMEALGYSTEQVESSMEKLGNGIDGLPTSLNEIVSSTQQIAIATGDLDKGTDTAIALNNAFLASGASSADASRGMQQYVQMLSKGAVDMQSWRSLQETMPIAMDKVAKSFKEKGVTSVNELYTALQKGDITFDEMNARLVELNEGVGGFAELARKNSQGIATSFANIRTAVTKGVANVITKVDELTVALSGKTIAQNLDSLKGVVNAAFKVVIDTLDKVVPVVQSVINIFSQLAKSKEVTALVDTFKWVSIHVTNAVETLVSAVKSRLPGIISSFQGLFSAVAPVVEKLADIIGIWVNTIANILSTEIPAAIDFLKGVFDSLVATAGPVLSKIADIFLDLSMIVTEKISGISSSFQDLYTILAPIIDKLAIAIGTWANTIADILSNVIPIAVDIFSGVFENLVATIGPILSKIADFFLDLSIVVAEKIGGIIPVLEDLKTLIEENKTVIDILTGVVVAAGGAFVGFKAYILGLKAISIVTGIITTLSAAFTTLSGLGITGVISAIGGLMGPVGWVLTAIGALVGVVIYLWNTNEGFRDAVINIWNAIKEAIAAAAEWVVNAWQSTISFFTNLWGALTEGASGAWEGTKKGVNSAVKSIKKSWEGVKSTVGNVVDSIVASWNAFKEMVTAVVVEVVGVIAGKFTEMKNFIQPIIQPMIDGIVLAFNTIKTTITTIWEQIQIATSAAWELIKNIVLAPVLAIVSFVTGGFDEMAYNMSAVWDNIKENASILWEAIQTIFVTYVTGIVDTVVALFTGWKDTVVNIFNTVKDAIIQAWETTKAAVIAKVVEMVEWVQTTWQNFKDSLVNTAVETKDSIVNGWETLKQRTAEIVASLITWFIDKWIGMRDSAVDTANDLVSKAGDAWQALKDSVSNAVETVKDFFHSLSEIDLYQIGKDIVQGLIDGVGDMISSVGETIGNVANSIKNKITDALGIHSPSRWMRDNVGSQIPAGIAVGIDKNSDVIDKSMSNLNKSIETPALENMVASLSDRKVVQSMSFEGEVSNSRPLYVTVQSILDSKVLAEETSPYLATTLDNQTTQNATSDGFRRVK